MGRIQKGILGALALGFAVPAVSSAVVVDDFEQGGVVLTQTMVGSQSAAQMGTMDHILGGHRQIDLTVSDILLFGSSMIQVETSNGVAMFSNTAGVEATMGMTWDNDGNGLGGVDMTEMGVHTGIRVDYLFSDLGSELTFIATDTFGNESSLTHMTSAGPSTQFFDYLMFVPVGAPTDFTSIDSLELVLDAPLAGDYLIDIIRSGTPNPEPATAMLGGLGLGALGLVTRRRRSS